MAEISDSEREAVVRELTRHCGDGRLTLDELEQRVGEAYAATTRDELTHALRELPRFPGADRDRPAAVPAGTGHRRTAAERRRRPAPARGCGLERMARPPAILLTISIVMLLTAHWIAAAILFMIALPKLQRTYAHS